MTAPPSLSRPHSAAATGGTPAGTPGGDELPPIFGSWGRLYAAVLIYLALLIVTFHLFSAWYS